MASDLNKSRRPTFYGVTLCVTCGTSCPSGAKKCRCCNTPIQKQTTCSADQDSEFDLLPTLGCCRGTNCQIVEEPRHQEVQLLSQLWEEAKSWQEDSSSSSPIEHKDTLTQANFSLDMELERCNQRAKSDATYPVLEQEPEYYSFDSTQMDCSQSNSTSTIQSVEPEHDSSLLAIKGSSDLQSIGETPLCPAEGNSMTSSHTEDSNHDDPFYRSDSVDDCPSNMTNGEELSSICDGESENFHSIMEDDKSILMCKTGEKKIPHTSGVSSVPISPSKPPVASGEPLEDMTSLLKITAVKWSTADRSTFCLTPVATCDVSVGTKQSLELCQSAATQTNGPATADKHVITKVHMADLDYLAEEFIKLKLAQEELKQLKEKMKSSGGTARKDCLAEGGCACTQHAQRAELCLLALQYSMCKQHFWRHYYTSPEGERFTLMQGDINRPEGPPANLLGVMQRLQSDYEEMRDKILAGEPLEQLKPLSVSSQVITTGSHYIPAQIIGDTLGNVTIGSSQQLDRQDGGEGYGGHGGPQGQNTKAPQSISLNRATATQGRTDPASQPKVDINKARKAVSLLPRKNDTSCGHRPAEKQTASPFKELDTNDTWYDAEEDLQHEQPAAEMGEASSVMTKGSAREAKSTSSVLCVSDLPRNVTEGDVMKLFEKSLASEVSITTFSNDLRVATVMVSDPQSAEVAVREMNGCSMQTNNPRAGSQSQAQQQSLTSKPGSSGDARKPKTSKTNSSNTTKNQPVGLSLEKQKVLCVLPTAKGTCVPQHYATMGSFGTLMAQLTERHPEVCRQRIVDALLELRANHKGVLSGLPLRAIMEMTSELLTKPVGPMQS